MVNGKEADVVAHFRAEVVKAGGVERLIQYRGRRGCADHLAGFPYNRLFLVELKRPKGGRISAHQEQDERDWCAVGVQKAYLYTREDVDHWIARVRA